MDAGIAAEPQVSEKVQKANEIFNKNGESGNSSVEGKKKEHSVGSTGGDDTLNIVVDDGIKKSKKRKNSRA